MIMRNGNVEKNQNCVTWIKTALYIIYTKREDIYADVKKRNSYKFTNTLRENHS